MKLCRKKPFKVSHHPTNFGADRHCGEGNIIVLVFQVISQDHVVKVSFEFMGRSPSW